eukprot:TRINITY_DN12614_c0_g4_i1.p1 TRINITY_DN12614_c0_g4~~TRINITY_DN12614_c0_g4_i1.p1  ORF type:complete len:681 (+),score=67.09 TRINITY_DN12614_c0_g4_i1:220-2043(+)
MWKPTDSDDTSIDEEIESRKNSTSQPFIVFVFWMIFAGLFLYAYTTTSLQPPSPHPEACGLQVPPGHHTAEYHGRSNPEGVFESKRYADAHTQNLHESVKDHDHQSSQLGVNDTWIWVDMHGRLPEPVRAGQWEYSADCFKIFKYDIATQSWADGCAKWCQQSFGQFVWNELCAFGLHPGDHRKALEVLRACQKAEVTLMFHLSHTACWLIGLSMLLCAILLGAIDYKVGSFPGGEPTFKKRDKPDGRIKLLPLVYLPCSFTRAQVATFNIVKLGLSMLLDIATDAVTSLTYLAHGQPYYSIVMLSVVVLNFGFGSFLADGASPVALWLWSLHKAVPAYELFVAKAQESNEAVASLAVLMTFLLKTPLHGDDGEAFLSKARLITIVLSLCTTLYTLYDAAACKWKVVLCSSQEDVCLDFDKRWELQETGGRYGMMPDIFVATRGAVAVALAGSLAIAVRYSVTELIALFVVVYTLKKLCQLAYWLKLRWCPGESLRASADNEAEVTRHWAWVQKTGTFAAVGDASGCVVFWYRWHVLGHLATLPWHDVAAHDTAIFAFGFIRCALVWITAVSVICAPPSCAALVAVIVQLSGKEKEKAGSYSLAAGE